MIPRLTQALAQWIAPIRTVQTQSTQDSLSGDSQPPPQDPPLPKQSQVSDHSEELNLESDSSESPGETHPALPEKGGKWTQPLLTLLEALRRSPKRDLKEPGKQAYEKSRSQKKAAHTRSKGIMIDKKAG